MSDLDRKGGVRLQKVLAAAGIASRRAAEQMIADGRVEVNGRLITEQGLRVDPNHDHIRVDGSRIPSARHHLYLVVNKPRGVVSTMEDPEGRQSLADFAPRHTRLFHVGRLDTDSEGLIIMTNDGEFAHRLAHPSFEVPKTYLAEVEGLVDQHALNRLAKGVTLDDGWVRADKIKLVSTAPASGRSMIQVTLHSGRNRVVRRMFDAVGHPVIRLSRIAIGPVRLGRLGSGESRELTRAELGSLLDAVSM